MMSDSTSASAAEIMTPRTAERTGRTLSYGWVMVGVAAMAMVATLPGRTHGLGMITERLLADPQLHLTRTSYGYINLWATLIGASFCLGCGRWIDRFGVRAVLPIVLLALGATVLWMTTARNAALLFFTIMLTRGFGQSALSVVSISIVGKWFEERLSWAMAVYSALMAMGFIAAALIGRNYTGTDWRLFWGVLGAIVLVLAPLAWLVTRNGPKQCRRLVDIATPSGDLSDLEPELTGATLGEALRTPAFWVFGLATSLFGTIAAGISLFNESILVDRGFPREVYYESLAIGAGIGLFSKFLAGWLASQWSITKLTSTALLVLAGALIWLTQLTTYTDVVIYVGLNAFAGGAITVIFFTVWASLYGRRHLGKVQGAAQMMTVVASALGPLLFAEVKARTGSYTPLLWSLAVVTFGLAIIAWITPLPTKPQIETTNLLP